METKGVYQITVQGKVNPDWSERLGGMEIVRHPQHSSDVVISVLTGELMDQAALVGILNFLYNTGFPLLTVKRLSPGARQ